VNKHSPLFEQSLNNEQFGNSQSPFEFLDSPSSHLLLHSPVFRLPIEAKCQLVFFIILKKKKKKKKR